MVSDGQKVWKEGQNGRMHGRLQNLYTSTSSRDKKRLRYERHGSSNGGHYGPIFKPEKNFEFFRLKNWPIDDHPGKLE